MVLKNGSLRLLMLCSSLNFALKSEEEQNAIIFQFQNFINALTFPVQIVIQSKRIDLSLYLNSLEERKTQVNNMLLQKQITDYIDFVKKLVSVANIMDKNFYVVIPWDVPNIKPDGFLAKLHPQKMTTIPIDDAKFQAGKSELLQRANVAAASLGSMGIRGVQLNTKELIELFYQTYNPETAQSEKLMEPDYLQGGFVSKLKET